MSLKLRFLMQLFICSQTHFDVNVNEQLEETCAYNLTSKLTCLMIQFCLQKKDRKKHGLNLRLTSSTG